MSGASDLVFALRLLARRPLVTALAILSLALGIGANSAVFSIAYALLLRPLPVHDPDRLVAVFTSWERLEPYGGLTWPDLRDLRASRTLEGAAAFFVLPVSLADPEAPTVSLGAMVTANYFDLLGLKPAAGRFFSPGEDRAFGSGQVAVLSHAYWRRAFSSSPTALSGTIKINNLPFQIIGVAPDGFTGTITSLAPDVWVPFTMAPRLVPIPFDPENRAEHWLAAFARLAPNTTLDQARAEAAVLSESLRRQYPDSNRGASFNLVPMRDARSPIMQLGTAVRSFVGVLTVLVALLLLLACANLAGMLLARAVERQKEMAMRSALGATRARLLRQLLSEGLMLALAGGAAGLLAARFMIDAVAAIPAPAPMPVDLGIRLDTPVLLFTLAVSLLAALFFSLIPSFSASRYDLVTALKEHGTAPLTRARGRWLSVLVSAQAGLAVVLLLAAGLCAKSWHKALDMHPGFEVSNGLAAGVNLGYGQYDQAAARAYRQRLLESVRAIPGVASASLTTMVPLSLFGNMDTEVKPPGADPSVKRMFVQFSYVAPDYFTAMGVKVLKGRPILEEDRENSRRVVVINEELARLLWPGQDPVGKVLRTSSPEGLLIVGVAANGKYLFLGERQRPYMFLPLSQNYSGILSLVARTLGDPQSFKGPVGKVIQELDPALPAPRVITLEEQLGLSLLPSRLAGYAAASFGFIALLLALIGVYGMIWYFVTQKRHEFGVRLALGANPATLIRRTVFRSLLVAAPGLALGIVLSTFISRPMRAFLYGLNPLDPAIFLTIPLLLVLCILLAALGPARRAASAGPLDALRVE